MDKVGYCTLEDVRRALRKADLPGDVGQDKQIATDAVAAETEPLEKSLSRHWYEPDGINEATAVDIPTAPKSRDDEESIPTGGTHIVDEPATPKTFQGDQYTQIAFHRRDVKSLEQLLVRNEDGEFVDWTQSSKYSGGTWPTAVGEDYYLRVNNGGRSVLRLAIEHFLDEDGDPLLDSHSNAVYVTYSYGHEGIPRNVRRAVALRAGAELAEEAAIGIPANATIYNIETKAEEMRSKADELLEVYYDRT